MWSGVERPDDRDQFVLGPYLDGRYFGNAVWEPEHDPALMVTGWAGSGKSWFVRRLADQAEDAGWGVTVIATSHPVEVADWQDAIRGRRAVLATTPNDAHWALDALVIEMELRLAAMAEAGVTRICELPGERPRPYLLVVDSEGWLGDVPGAPHDVEGQRRVAEFAREGGAAGIYVVVAAQRSLGSGLGSAAGANLRFGPGSQHDVQVSFRDPSRAPDYPAGAGRSGAAVFECAAHGPRLVLNNPAGWRN